jgi:hypothetical protein
MFRGRVAALELQRGRVLKLFLAYQLRAYLEQRVTLEDAAAEQLVAQALDDERNVVGLQRRTDREKVSAQRLKISLHLLSPHGLIEHMRATARRSFCNDSTAINVRCTVSVERVVYGNSRASAASRAMTHHNDVNETDRFRGRFRARRMEFPTCDFTSCPRPGVNDGRPNRSATANAVDRDA